MQKNVRNIHVFKNIFFSTVVIDYQSDLTKNMQLDKSRSQSIFMNYFWKQSRLCYEKFQLTYTLQTILQSKH